MPAPDQLLDALDPEQRQVAEALRGPVRVLAGAGTGKTRAITHRIAYGVATGVYAPTEVLAVTFTTRAAGEMRERLRSLGAGGVQARTFHSAALRQLRFFWPRVHGVDPPALTESKLGLLALAARRQRVAGDQALLKDLAAEIEWAKVSNVAPEEYPAVAVARGRTTSAQDPGTVGRVFAAYEEVKRSQGRMDMEDVLLLAAGLLADDARVAAQVRGQYKWFVVDEFQDVSPLQSALLDLWRGDREEICVVGDPAQTIYSFAGASSSYLRDFPTRHPGTVSVELVRNYRSTPQVVGAANRLLGAGTSAGVELRAQRPAGPAVTYVECPDEPTEAVTVAGLTTRLRAQGVALGQIAVLYRINAQSEAFEDAFTAHAVPYVVRGAARFFDRAEVRRGLTLLRGAAHAGEGTEGLPDAVRAVLSGMGWTPNPPAGRGQTRDRWESLQALVDQATVFAATVTGAGGTAPATSPGAKPATGPATAPATSDLPADLSGESVPSLADFVAELDRRAVEQHAPVADGVTLATLHAAKGLEWDAVFVCGLQEGTMPIAYAETPAAVEEERRLLYVGMTRARVHLTLSWSLARNPGGRQSRTPSRFLDPLRPPERSVAGAVGPSRAARRRRAAHCRECGRPLESPAEKKTGRCAGCPASYDEDLFDRLRAWRLDRAGHDSVPAYVVFTDATLQLIAELRPRTEGDLLRISGIGRAKLERYGTEILALVGQQPADREPSSG